MIAPAPDARPRHVAVRAAAVFAAAFAWLWRLQFTTPVLPGFDGWFHIKYAELLPSIGFTHRFKWAAESVWAEHYADKELLFHAILVPFTRLGDLVAGGKLATVLLGTAVVVSFFLVLALRRTRYPEAWTLLLVASGSVFDYRLCLLRPHLVSIALLLWSVHLILERRRLALAAVIFVYALSYTAYHLPLALALIVAADGFLHERELDWKTPAAIAGAMVAGILVNPYFPENFRAFWAHNFVVPWMSVRTDLDLGMAGELESLSTRWLLVEHLPIAALAFGAVYLALVRPRRVSRATRGLFLIACVYVVLTLLMHRFVEYSVPITLWLLAAFYSEHLADFGLRRTWASGGLRRRVAAAAALLCAVAASGFAWKAYGDTSEKLRADHDALADAAVYLRDRAEPDELVFTCDWDDSPQLFFFDDRNRYPVLMDPVLMYLWDPDRWREWSKTAHGGFKGRTWNELADRYRYGVCTWDFKALKRIVERDPRMEVVHDDPGAYVFRVDRDAPDIPLGTFLDLGDEP